MASSASKARQPGRPAGRKNTDTQEKIVQEACLLFARQGIKGTSNQMLADKARVTPAMIHYYFKQRDDLYKAVMDHAFSFVQEKLVHAKSLDHWVRIFHENLIQHPWIPHLMIREVIPHGGQLQPYFLKHIGPATFGSMREQMIAESWNNSLGPGFDIERHIMLLMAMLVYPFIGREIAETLTGRQFNDEMMVNFREDALALFEAGITARASAAKGRK